MSQEEVRNIMMLSPIKSFFTFEFVTPLINKPGLDTTDMNNYRPVSYLLFMSKLIERVVAIQLNDCLSAKHLVPRFQSAYRKGHSIETAPLQVWSDMLMAADERKVTLLSLLDMSAAFDCADGRPPDSDPESTSRHRRRCA